MLNKSVLDPSSTRLKLVTGFEDIDLIYDFIPYVIQRSRGSDLEYTSRLRIQYFTYYVVLIELDNHSQLKNIAVLKHEVFYPNKKGLIDANIGRTQSYSGAFREQVKNIVEANNLILDGALVNRLELLHFYCEEFKRAALLDKFRIQGSLQEQRSKLEESGDFTLNGIHKEAFNYFRFGQIPLWHKTFIQELREQEIEKERRQNYYAENSYEIEEAIWEADQGYEDEGQWFYAGDYPEDNVPD